MDEAWSILVLLASGETALEFEPVLHGANNRLFRVRCESGAQFALKHYPEIEGDNRNRLKTEFSSLDFLAPRVGSAVPKAIGYDKPARVALYEWIDGAKVDAHSAMDVHGAVDFVRRLKELTDDDQAKNLPEASEACLSFEELTLQIEKRFSQLMKVSGDQPDLSEFLKGRFQPRFQSLRSKASRKLTQQIGMGALTRSSQCLSPSDFGFHNALRRPDGRLVFVDFEYFGWDDPVKLVSDFLLHPGMELSTADQQQFLHGMQLVFSDDSAFADRLELCFPFYALRWCMILLNEYLPDVWQRRQAAGIGGDVEDIKQRQLLKAESWLIKSEGSPERTPT